MIPTTLVAPPGLPDPRRVRRRSARTAARFDTAAAVHRELGRRLMEHLDPVRLAPRRILDLGCATGALTRALAERYREADILGVDLAQPRARRAHRARPRWFPRERYLCADGAALPLPDGCVELVCGNLILPWISDPAALFRESARVLGEGGLIMLCTLGPDSLRELRERLPGHEASFHPLADMHAVADALVSAGFGDVVADTEHLGADYHGPADLLRELRATGSTFCGAAPASGTRRTLSALLAQDQPDPFRVTYEVVYLHAWLANPAAARHGEPA